MAGRPGLLHERYSLREVAMLRRDVLWIASLVVALGCSGERADELDHANDESPFTGGDGAVEESDPADAGWATVGTEPSGKDEPVDAGPIASEDAGPDATASIEEHTLTVSRSGGNGAGKVVGTSLDTQVIDCEGAKDDCAETLLEGTEVVLTAEPASDSTFTWGGACAGERSAQCTVTLDQAKPVTVSFQLRVYTVTLTVRASNPLAGYGTVRSVPDGFSCTNTFGQPTAVCTAQFEAHTPLSLTATPTPTSSSDPNYFEGWSNACAPAGSDELCTFTVESDLTVDATFTYIVG